MTKFDHEVFDEVSQDHAKTLKILTENLDGAIRGIHQGGQTRYTSLALTSLEEMFMWTGKAIREAQMMRQNAADGKTEEG